MSKCQTCVHYHYYAGVAPSLSRILGKNLPSQPTNYCDYAKVSWERYSAEVKLQLRKDIFMKCIKEKCRYYQDHEFYNSYCRCTLLDKSFKKYIKIDCLMPDIIKDMENELNELREYYKIIKDEKL